jgi:hypothetical protein
MPVITGLAAIAAVVLPTIGPISLTAGAGFGIGAGTWAIAMSFAQAALPVEGTFCSSIRVSQEDI